ncbi:MAG: radical SAM protein [Anaerolineales bacterium]|nr:radical SAM protein [Chloroflexota bacterium]MBL6979798.1 radical SAM protein [Anaerolineales bacterium]
MTSIREAVRNLFVQKEPLPVGIFHYQAPPDADFPYRLHLRLEPDGGGLLIVNASTVLHLNQTAAEYAYHLVQNSPDDVAASQIATRYQVSKNQALEDFKDLKERLLTMIDIPDLDPITFFDFERDDPYAGEITAPYRLDCALTYRLPEGADPDAAPTKRVDHELSTEEWSTIIDKAWEIGIPHIVFTGGEPTLRNDLPDLIAHAEANGQVTGLLTDGLKLADNDYLNALLQTGLDHLMVLLHPEDESAWAALDNVLPQDLHTTVHLTLTQENAASASALLERLANMGVNALSLSESSPDLNEILQTTADLAAEFGLSLVWDVPVPYSTHNPIALETAEDEPPQGAGRAWLYVEPDGDVLPTQGVNQVLGNLLQDDWDKIIN